MPANNGLFVIDDPLWTADRGSSFRFRFHLKMFFGQHCLHESVALSMPLYINLRMTSTPYFMSFFLAWHKELSNPGCCSFQFVDSLSASPLFRVPYILVRTESEWAESLAFSSMHLCMKFPYTQPVPHHLEPPSRECRFFF